MSPCLYFYITLTVLYCTLSVHLPLTLPMNLVCMVFSTLLVTCLRLSQKVWSKFGQNQLKYCLGGKMLQDQIDINSWHSIFKILPETHKRQMLIFLPASLSKSLHAFVIVYLFTYCLLIYLSFYLSLLYIQWKKHNVCQKWLKKNPIPYGMSIPAVLWGNVCPTS